MNASDEAHTLAEKAASWVPPWARAGESAPDAVEDAAVADADAEVEVDESAAGTNDTAESPVGGWPTVDMPQAEEQPVEEAAFEEVPAPGELEPLPQIPDGELMGALEAILLVVDEPVADAMLAQVLDQPTAKVAALLEELANEFTAMKRGFELRRAAGGWRLYTRGDYAPYVERFVLDGQQARLTQAALETLAVVAYKQPVTRSRMSAIRGVNCDGVVRTLVSRGLIEECGQEPESGAFLYRTTSVFLEKLGMDSLEELPPLAPFLPDVDELANATG